MLICDIYNKSYELKKGESIDDYGVCECGGTLHLKNNILFCPKCGVQREYDAKFCQNCGVSFKKLDEMNKDKKTIHKCPYCAEEIKSGAVKCKHCGEWLNKKAKAKKRIILQYLFWGIYSPFLEELLVLFLLSISYLVEIKVQETTV